MNTRQLHSLNDWLAVILGGIETGRLDLALDAARKMAAVLSTCHPDMEAA